MAVLKIQRSKPRRSRKKSLGLGSLELAFPVEINYFIQMDHRIVIFNLTHIKQLLLKTNQYFKQILIK